MEHTEREEEDEDEAGERRGERKRRYVEKGRKTGFREETQRKRGIAREDFQNNPAD